MLHVRRQEQGTADPYFRGAGKVAKMEAKRSEFFQNK